LVANLTNFKERIFSRRPCPHCDVTLLNARGLHAHVYRLHPEKLHPDQDNGNNTTGEFNLE